VLKLDLDDIGDVGQFEATWVWHIGHYQISVDAIDFDSGLGSLKSLTSAMFFKDQKDFTGTAALPAGSASSLSAGSASVRRPLQARLHQVLEAGPVLRRQPINLPAGSIELYQ
jgi:hypothetical protein